MAIVPTAISIPSMTTAYRASAHNTLTSRTDYCEIGAGNGETQHPFESGVFQRIDTRR